MKAGKDGPFPMLISPEEVKKVKLTPIMQVTDVQIVEAKLNRDTIIIDATGHTKTIQWHFIELRPRPGSKNGIYEFDFIGDGSRALLDAIGTVKASYVFDQRPADFRGVRVHSATTVISKSLA